MKKFKRLLALLIMGGALSSIFAAGADIVVLMDSSGTILPWFDEINNRILVDITKKFVREGDTFHLISFNSRVNLEIAQPVTTEADVSRIVSRFMLLYPLGQNSDFLSGLQYIWQYVSSLDTQREKIIIVISDGIFNPPTSSRYASYTPDQVQAEISDVARRIRGAGWNVYYIKLPFPQNAEIRTLDGNLLANTNSTTDITQTTQTAADKKKPVTGVKSGQTGSSTSADTSIHKYYDVSSEFTSDLSIKSSSLPEKDVPITFIDQVFSMPEVAFPEDLGKRGRFFILPLKITNTSNTPVNMELTGVFTDTDVNLLSKSSFLNLSARSSGTLHAQISIPDTIPKGPQDINMRLHFSDDLRVLPQSSSVHMTITGFSFGQLFRTGSSILFAVIIIGIAAILVIFLFFFIMRRTAKPASDAIRTANASATAAERMPEAAQKKGTTLAVPAAKAKGLTASSILENTATNAQQSRSAKPAIASEVGSVASNTAETASILAQAGATADRKTIEYRTEKKEYPSTSAVAPKADVSGSLNALSTQQASDKNDRLSVLANAAIKRLRPVQENRKGASASEQIEVRGTSRVMVELDVHNQNTSIGKRNIHMLKAGSRLSVGGGQSAFLVFLVKFPAHIAELRYDGVTCSMAILKPEYFPYETENVIQDCMERSFTIISDRDYEVTFDFRIYEDPVIKLNRLLTSIKY